MNSFRLVQYLELVNHAMVTLPEQEAPQLLWILFEISKKRNLESWAEIVKFPKNLI